MRNSTGSGLAQLVDLPRDLLLHSLTPFLHTQDAVAMGRTCHKMVKQMKLYQIESPASLDEILPTLSSPLRFGVYTNLRVDALSGSQMSPDMIAETFMAVRGMSLTRASGQTTIEKKEIIIPPNVRDLTIHSSIGKVPDMNVKIVFPSNLEQLYWDDPQDVKLPDSVTKITLREVNSSMYVDVKLSEWPNNLTYLDIEKFSPDRVPPFPHSLLTLRMGGSDEISVAAFPSTLTSLSCHNLPFDITTGVDHHLPSDLRTLKVFSWRQDWAGVRLPQQLQVIDLGGSRFNLDELGLPVTLEDVTLHGIIDIRSVKAPFEPLVNLRSLNLRGARLPTDIPIVWPPNLRRLRLPLVLSMFTPHSPPFPSTLELLDFHPSCNPWVNDLKLPASLRKLFLGVYFNQSMDKLQLNEGLEELVLGGMRSLYGNFNQPMHNVKLPSTLKKLSLAYAFKQPPECLPRLPPSLRLLRRTTPYVTPGLPQLQAMSERCEAAWAKLLEELPECQWEQTWQGLKD